MSRRLAANVALRDPATGQVVTFAAGGTLPGWAEGVTNEGVWDAGGSSDVEGMSLDELKAEVDSRNADRADGERLARSGTKAELVKRLADDAS